jgi:hypothetical protein
MSDPAITIDLIALSDWEDSFNPNRDSAFDADEALGNICPGCDGTGLEIIYHSAAVSWETGEPLDSEEIHCRTCGGGGYLTAPAFDEDEALPVTVVNLTNCPETVHTENASLPAPWRMSIEELDSWVAFYRTRLRGLGLGCGALTDAELRHRGDIDRNVALRDEARRHSYYS